MNKLKISLSKDVDEDSIYPSFPFPECSNIINQFDYDSVTSDNFVKVIDFIIAYLYKYQSFEEVVDITTRNNALAPTKMTKTEIEKALGYPIDIVEEERV